MPVSIYLNLFRFSSASRAWAGLDTPTVWASIVVPKIPFSSATVLDEKIEGQVYVLDGRYKGLGAFVPERSQEPRVEGDIRVYLQAESKRMRGINERNWVGEITLCKRRYLPNGRCNFLFL